MEIGNEGFLLVFDAHQGGREARDFPLLGEHQRDRLPAEHDLVVVERTERRAVFRRHIVLVRGRLVGHARPIFVREHVEYAFDAQRVAGVDARDAAFGDRRWTTLPKARSAALNSPAYFAAPVTLAGPSMREVGVPM